MSRTWSRTRTSVLSLPRFGLYVITDRLYIYYSCIARSFSLLLLPLVRSLS